MSLIFDDFRVALGKIRVSTGNDASMECTGKGCFSHGAGEEAARGRRFADADERHRQKATRATSRSNGRMGEGRQLRGLRNQSHLQGSNANAAAGRTTRRANATTRKTHATPAAKWATSPRCAGMQTQQQQQRHQQATLRRKTRMHAHLATMRQWYSRYHGRAANAMHSARTTN